MNAFLTTLVQKWLDGERIPIASRRMLFVLVALSATSLSYACLKAGEMTEHLRHGEAYPSAPADQGDSRFGVSLALRRQVFAELAEAEPAARVEGARAFPGPELAWSADDHRGALERREIARVVAMHHITMTQAYLILDEGIRAHWPGPNGHPLEATTTPLHPRRNYGW